MSDRPILFSAPMIRALLDGRKTMTRRVLNPQPRIRPELHEPSKGAPFWCVFDGDEIAHKVRIHFVPGDRLWVREAWQQSGFAWGGRPTRGMGRLHYRATDDGGWKEYWGGWRSPIHMPRWASRLTLTVTDVRVQRLQEISEEDAIAEGMPADNWNDKAEFAGYFSPAEAFLALWNSINAARGYGWEANPWVVAISFTVEHRNIDALEVAA